MIAPSDEVSAAPSTAPFDSSGHQRGIRVQWHFDVITAMQRLANDLFGAPRECVEDAFIRFLEVVPRPDGEGESVALRKELVPFCSRAGHQIHRDQHHGPLKPSCGMRAVTDFESLWTTGDKAPLFLLRLWLSRFLKALDVNHESGLPVREARVLRRTPNRCTSEDELARKLGCSRSVLLRRFYSRYGLTPKAYHSRVRIRAGVRALRVNSTKVDSVAFRLGYHGTANFYSALDRFTGLTPSAIRCLQESEVEVLFSTVLEINPARLLASNWRGSDTVMQHHAFATPSTPR